jgi:transposase InsO family protein
VVFSTYHYKSRRQRTGWSSATHLDFSRPGKPTGNAFTEAFNGRFRAECLSGHCFPGLEDIYLEMSWNYSTVTLFARFRG